MSTVKSGTPIDFEELSDVVNQFLLVNNSHGIPHSQLAEFLNFRDDMFISTPYVVFDAGVVSYGGIHPEVLDPLVDYLKEELSKPTGKQAHDDEPIHLPLMIDEKNVYAIAIWNPRYPSKVFVVGTNLPELGNFTRRILTDTALFGTAEAKAYEDLLNDHEPPGWDD